jgi:glycosyltransferase involved in cell wall biosynthesis
VRLPPNVELLARPAPARIATQCALNAPRLSSLFRHRSAAIATLAAVGGISPRVFIAADAWLWPHCFGPIPNLKRAVAIYHDMIHRHHPEYFSRSALTRRAHAEASLPVCASLLCPSKATADDLLSAYPALRPQVRLFAESPCEVMREEDCAIERKQLDARYGDTPLFLFVGVDWPHKNHQLLIDAAVALRRMTSKPFKILFAGHRRSGTIAKEIARKQALDVVIDVGSVSRPMLAALYRHSTALVFPSLCEGFGIPLVEAMQYGLPIIASDRSCIPEICGDGALLLPPTMPELWAHEMLSLMVDKDHRARLAAFAQERGRAFSWQRTWRQIDEAFSAVLEGEQSNGAESSPPWRPPPIGQVEQLPPGAINLSN